MRTVSCPASMAGLSAVRSTHAQHRSTQFGGVVDCRHLTSLLKSVLVLNSPENSGKHFVIVADELDEFLAGLDQEGTISGMHRIGSANRRRNQLVPWSFLNTHEKT